MTFIEKLLVILGVPKGAQDAIKNANGKYEELSYEESLKRSCKKLKELNDSLHN